MEMIIDVEESMPKKDQTVPYYDDPPNFNLDVSQNPHVGGAGGSFTEQYPEHEMKTSISVDDDQTIGLDDGFTHVRGRKRSSKAEKLKSISENLIMDSDVPEHGRVVKRKKSGVGKSQYQSRVVDGSTYVPKEQRELCFWIMDNINLSR
ncbi:hypothetical protein CASFOL_022978 [Castilleja foliolosa]|uniref:Uncharacterized protein n=1 Tax=Castilleja foliolosa TaxID=1961234 RepID=A0ABD3CT90_9LAMI